MHTHCCILLSIHSLEFATRKNNASCENKCGANESHGVFTKSTTKQSSFRRTMFSSCSSEGRFLMNVGTWFRVTSLCDNCISHHWRLTSENKFLRIISSFSKIDSSLRLIYSNLTSCIFSGTMQNWYQKMKTLHFGSNLRNSR